MVLERLGDDREVLREPAVVRVEKGDDSASCEADAGIASRADSLVRLPVVAQARVHSRERVAGAVGRAVVDHDQLEVGERLREDAAHRPPDVLATLERRNDHRDRRRRVRGGVHDAPEAWLDGQLRGIVGIELTVTRVEGKAKLSQNRSDADRAGVVAGLSAGSAEDRAVAAAMSAGLVPAPSDDPVAPPDQAGGPVQP